jgi:tripartite-type tricarboxylate transporter receptor subunit TctC
MLHPAVQEESDSERSVRVQPCIRPFTGGPPATSALLGGQVDYMCNTIPEVVQQIQTGSIKGYAVSTANRNPTLPNVPTAKEAGLSDFEFSAWYGLFAPKGTPKPVLDKLTDTIDRALDDEATRKRLTDLGCDIPPKATRGRQALGALVKSEIARWSRSSRLPTSRANNPVARCAFYNPAR